MKNNNNKQITWDLERIAQSLDGLHDLKKLRFTLASIQEVVSPTAYRGSVVEDRGISGNFGWRQCLVVLIDGE